MSDGPDDFTNAEQAWFAIINAAVELALRCRDLKRMNDSISGQALDHGVNTLMTEFWDQGFTQTEIRKAFDAALEDMNRYAAGCERRP
jgi:hypothetical protein